MTSGPSHAAHCTGRVITLSDLELFDNSPARGAERDRYRCPFPECNGKQGRSLSVDVSNGCYKCHRCGAKGKMGSEATIGLIARVRPPYVPWEDKLEGFGIAGLGHSPGQSYLEGRGIPYSLARQCNVQYAPRFYNRPAVLFPVHDVAGKRVAMQGRFLEDSPRGGPNALTIGRKSEGVFTTPAGLGGNTISITEAPIDAMSLLLLKGTPAVATLGVTADCPPVWLLLHCKGKRVVLAFDADEPGDAAAEAWSKHLRDARAQSVERLRPPRPEGVDKWDWNKELMWRKSPRS